MLFYLHKPDRPGKQCRRRRPPFNREGRRKAVIKAKGGALLLQTGAAGSIRQAAEMSGSNPVYVGAMSMLLRYGDSSLIHQTEVGDIFLLDAKAEVRFKVQFLELYRRASPADHIDTFRKAGIDKVFDELAAAA
jgi:hypothetical protein